MVRVDNDDYDIVLFILIDIYIYTYTRMFEFSNRCKAGGVRFSFPTG